MKVCLACNRPFEADNWCCPHCGKSPQSLDGFVAFAPDMVNSDNGFNKSFFAELVRVEASNFWFRSRNRLLCWAMAKYFPEARSFFELGCGTGFVISAIQNSFPKLAVAGGDLYTEGLQHAKMRAPQARFFQMDARYIPFKEEFDIIGAFDILEHVEEDNVVLRQMYNAVKAGGGVLLTVPQHKLMWSRTDSFAGHKRRYGRKELVKKVRDAGFDVLCTTSFVSALLPLMILSRLRQRRLGEDWDPLSEFKISRCVNVLLEKVLTVERGLIRSGVSFPAGGSLLVVARRS